MKINYINKDNFNMEAETPQEQQILELIITCFMDSKMPEKERRYLKVYTGHLNDIKILSIQQRFESKEVVFNVEFDGKNWEKSEGKTNTKRKKK